MRRALIDAIVAAALSAAAIVVCTWAGDASAQTVVGLNLATAHATRDEFESSASAVAAVVREQCAQECESLKVGLSSFFEIDERIQRCADEIRSMKT